MPTISVVIPCLNEEKYVGKLLDDLAAQVKKPDEVIVADCRSHDKTVEVAHSYEKKLPLKIVSVKTRSPGAARNAGAKTAASEYLLFIDADMRIPTSTVESIQESLKENPVDFLTPRFLSDRKKTADIFLVWTINHWMNIYNNHLHKPAGIGGFMCVKRLKHEDIDGFNENKLAQNDIDYILKLRRSKCSFTYLSGLGVVNSSRRFNGKGLVGSLILLLIENSVIARWVIQPTLKGVGMGKKYGHHS